MDLRFLHKITREFIKHLENKDIEREISAQWSYMHLFSSIQLSKIIAQKRNLIQERAVYCVLFHDIATIMIGIRDNHAEIGADMFIDFIEATCEQYEIDNYFSEEDIIVIKDSILKHSDKESIDINEYVEFTKDIDSYDRYLYGIESEGAYLTRINRVKKELGLIL